MCLGDLKMENCKALSTLVCKGQHLDKIMYSKSKLE